MTSVLRRCIEELQLVEEVPQYEQCLEKLIKALTEEGCSYNIVQSAREKGKYMTNKFSDEATKDNMLKSKRNLMDYLDSLGQDLNTEQAGLKYYLHNFYLFLEAFREEIPHQKSTLKPSLLQSIQIQNEYDLQHILYAVIKPIFPDSRREVAEDSGYGTIRSDIKIPSMNTVVETKCTRKSTNLKKITEEIEADMVHYDAKYIYFYIYDKEKIIKNRQVFESRYSGVFDGKRIETIVLQPIHM